MVVGASHTGLCQELQHCWVFHTHQFPMYIKNGSPPKGHQDHYNVMTIKSLEKLTELEMGWLINACLLNFEKSPRTLHRPTYSDSQEPLLRCGRGILFTKRYVQNSLRQ
jgi:hypothetical protein